MNKYWINSQCADGSYEKIHDGCIMNVCGRWLASICMPPILFSTITHQFECMLSKRITVVDGSWTGGVWLGEELLNNVRKILCCGKYRKRDVRKNTRGKDIQWSFHHNIINWSIERPFFICIDNRYWLNAPIRDIPQSVMNAFTDRAIQPAGWAVHN